MTLRLISMHLISMYVAAYMLLGILTSCCPWQQQQKAIINSGSIWRNLQCKKEKSLFRTMEAILITTVVHATFHVVASDAPQKVRRVEDDVTHNLAPNPALPPATGKISCFPSNPAMFHWTVSKMSSFLDC